MEIAASREKKHNQLEITFQMAFQSNRKEKKHKQHRVVNKMANVEVGEIEMEIKNQLKCVCRN